MPTSRARRSAASRGFVTTEILVAVAIVAMVGTLGVMTLGGRDRAIVTSEAADMALFLQQARLRAAESGQRVDLTFDGDAGQLIAGPVSHDVGNGIAAVMTPGQISISPSGENDGVRIDLERKAERAIVTMNWLTGQVEVVR